MEQKVNNVYTKLFTEKPRYFILMGGRGAGRSTVASQYALAHLIAPEYFRCAIMRYILGDIRNSIYREITDRADENGITENLKINDSLMHIEYKENSINAVGFRKSSSDQKSKLKSLASYNCVIIEEADEIPEDDFRQLDDSLRTIKGDITIILLLNPPPKNHWIITRWFDLIDTEAKGYYKPQLKKDITDTIAITTDYHDNIANIADATATQYENYRTSKPSHYYNMIKGYVPETVVGKIYSNWVQIDEAPPEAKLKRRGLDYGYSNDPTAIVDVYVWNKAYIWDEVLYKTNMSNRDIADVIKRQQETLVIPDSSEPKSNDELRSYGIPISPAQKGKGSVNQGIQFVKDQTIYVTKRSVNIWKEYENYAWEVDKKTGETYNVPIDKYNHCFVGNTEIRTVNGYKYIKDINMGDFIITSKGMRSVVKRWDNGLKLVTKYRLQFDTFSVTIICTSNHKIKTTKGWIPISQLQSGMMVYHNNYLGELPIVSIQKKDTSQEEQKECTQRYGNHVMDLFRTDIMSIIKIIIHGIIGLKTSLLLKTIYIYQNTLKKGLEKIVNGLNHFNKKELYLLKNGTRVKLGNNGISSMEKEHGIISNTKLLYAFNVGTNTKHGIVVYPNIAIKTAKLKRLDIGESWNENVYDLQVDGVHEYFANTILVHNSMDAGRYAMEYLQPVDESLDDLPDDTSNFKGGYY